MDETIIVSPIDNPYESLPYSRKQFYAEQNGDDADRKDKYAVHVVAVLLIDPNGDIIVQKRSLNKEHNAGLIDKTLGGHITHGDEADYTVMVESVQELQTPSIVVDGEDDFEKALKLLHPYVDTVAIIMKKQTRPWKLVRSVAGKERHVHNITNLYFGVYGGRMRPSDKEASGMLYYSFEQLLTEMKSSPKMFTNDLIELCHDYERDITDFRAKIKHIWGNA